MSDVERHLTEAEAGRWVAGLLEPEDAGPLAVHLRGCAACTRLLQAEARAELALGAAVAEARRTPWRPRRRLGMALAVAAAAALVLGLLTVLRATPPAGVEVPRYEGSAELPVAEGPAPL